MSPAVAFRKAAQLLEDDQCLGCCVALIRATGSTDRGLRLVREMLGALLGYDQLPDHYGYWWPVNGPEHECVTPRIIALELVALLCEDEPLSKKRKR